ncbi:MAG: carboxypeptidase-like regulatory domain-containing protein [Archangium sp.]
MTAVIRKTLWAATALAALALAACSPPPPKPDGGTDAGASEDCVDDTDCPDSTYFFCNTQTSKCEPACRTAAQCNMRPAQYTLDFCGGTLGCQCDEGKCVGSLCSADSDCGSQVCRNGACVAPPAAATVAKCAITPDLAVVAAGEKVKFWVSAWDAQNNPVVVKDGATWAVQGTALTGTPAAANSAEFTAGTAAAALGDAVQATIGTTTCKAKAIVVAAPAAGSLGVSVIDELSGRPIAGAKVMLSNSDGMIIQQTGAVDTLDTGADGTAVLSTTGLTGGATVSVFHNGFSYVTVANYTGSSRLLSFALRRNALDSYGGYKGGFTNVPMTSNVHAALAGMSLAGSITNLNITQLLGPSEPTDIVIGSAINQMDVPIPAGAFLGFGDQQIKNHVAGQGLNGVCGTTLTDPSSPPDEAKITAGLCGTRAAWALAGDVPLGDLPIDAVAGGLDNIDIGMLLGRIIPIFKKFNSSIKRDVPFTLIPTPGASTGNPDFSNNMHYTTADHDFTQIPLAFNFVIKTGTLPQFKGAYADGVAVIGGASAPGRGVIPLGIGVGINRTPQDGEIDAIMPLSKNQIGVRMAPTHHGIEGAHYGLLMAAISAAGLNDASAGLGASALFPRLPGNKLVFDPAGATPVDVSTQAFPVFPEGAKFNFTNTMDGTLKGRSFRIPAAVAGVNVLRVSFSDDLETRWDVLVDAATPNFTLPVPPAGTRDRLFANGMSSGDRGTMVVQAFRMQVDPLVTSSAAVTFNNYVEFNGTNSDRTTDFLTAFSFLTYAPPTIKFTTPNATGATITAMSKLVVAVKSFSIGSNATDDGQVRFSFTPATNCPAMSVPTEVMMKGSGNVEFPLPAGCTGAVQIKAELVKIDGTTPVAPAVAATISATIN